MYHKNMANKFKIINFSVILYMKDIQINFQYCIYICI